MKPQIKVNTFTRPIAKTASSSQKFFEEKKNVHLSVEKNSKLLEANKVTVKSPVHKSVQSNNFKTSLITLEKKNSSNSNNFLSPKGIQAKTIFSPTNLANGKKFNNFITKPNKIPDILITSTEEPSNLITKNGYFPNDKQLGHFSETSFTKEKPLLMTHTEYNSNETLEKMQEPISLDEDEKTSFDKDSLAATFKSTIEGKNEIIEALNNKIKVLEQTLKGYESSKQTTPKNINIIAAGKKQVFINLEKKNQIMSPKGVSSTKSSTTNLNKIGNLKHSSTKKNFLFLNEVTKNMGKNSLKTSEIKSPRGTSPRINNSVIKSPNEKSSKTHPHHHSSDNGSILNQLQIIRERTKSVLERYRENHHSLVLKMRSMNNSELGR